LQVPFKTAVRLIIFVESQKPGIFDELKVQKNSIYLKYYRW